MGEPEHDSTKPWVTVYDEYGDSTGELRGNQPGLQKLKALIDEALEKGQAKSANDTRFDFQLIQVDQIHPSDRPYTKTKKELFTFGCLALLALAVLLIFAGIWKVADLLFK